MSDLDNLIIGRLGIDAHESITRVITGAAVAQTSITAVGVTAPSTFTKASIDASFAVGDVITVTGFTDPANNGTFTIASEASGSITVAETTLVNEAANGTVKKKATLAVTGIGAHFKPGDTVYGVGFANAGNNRSSTVHSVSANSIEVNDTDFVTESAGDGIVKRGDYLDALQSVRGTLGEGHYAAALAVAVP